MNLLLLLCSVATAAAQVAGPILRFSPATNRVSELDAQVTVTLARDGDASGAISVDFATGGWAAAPNLDYIPVNGTLTWASDDFAPKTITVTILRDQFEEEPQPFNIELSNPVGATIHPEAGLAEITIEDPAVRFEELWGSVYNAPVTLPLQASVSGFVPERVEFFEGDRLLAAITQPGGNSWFTFTWETVPRGSYTVRARAVDAQGRMISSPSRTLMVVAPPADVGLLVAYVNINSSTGLDNGSIENPFVSIQRAVQSVAPGGVIRVARGFYPESILIDIPNVELLGGFTPDFQTRDPRLHRTEIRPQGGRTAFALYNAGATVIDGFDIADAARGFFIAGEAVAQSTPTLRNNRIANNGEPMRFSAGGGVHAENSSLTLLDNEILGNRGGRGAGLSMASIGGQITMRRNLVSGNTAYDDHGGGLYIMASGVISENLITQQRGRPRRRIRRLGWRLDHLRQLV